MGILRDGINEVIATTRFNAAPMGIHFRNGTTRMVLFMGTHTAENIERDRWVVANLVRDPVLYVKTAFEDIPREMYREEPVNGRIMHRLADADAWIAFSACVERRTTEVMIVQLTAVKEIIEDLSVQPVNRGFNSLIDATVHATRYRERRNPDLKKLIDYHCGIVKKCGGKRENEALDLLLDYIR